MLLKSIVKPSSGHSGTSALAFVGLRYAPASAGKRRSASPLWQIICLLLNSHLSPFVPAPTENKSGYTDEDQRKRVLETYETARQWMKEHYSTAGEAN